MPTIVKAKAEEDSDSSNGVTKTRLSTNRAQMRRRAEGSDLEMWSEHGAGILCRVATADKITAKMLRMAVRDRSPINCQCICTLTATDDKICSAQLVISSSW